MTGNPLMSGLGEIPGELVGAVLPATITFVIDKTVANVVSRVVEPHAGMFGKHIKPLASLIGSSALMWLANRTNALKSWKTPIVVGAGLAFVHTALGCYFPKIARFINAGPRRSMPMLEQTESTNEADILLFAAQDPISSQSQRAVGADSEDDIADLQTGIFAAQA